MNFRNLVFWLFMGLVLMGMGCARFAAIYGPRYKVIFTYAAPAQSVCVSGDFNAWSKGEDCLRNTSQGWTKIMYLAPGRYSYAFWVNGTVYEADQEALLQEDDGFGNINSLLVVP